MSTGNSSYGKHIVVLLSILLVLSCSTQEHRKQEALDFLYAYMPTPDSVDYPEEFWRRNVDCSFQAREEMPWGDSVPEREFRHFVLPVRVNNESLDSSRTVFYAELKERVRGLSMRDAILEVNHWCHEKVTYTPSDERTSSPLATLRTAYGRCGEESTFTVAALRSVCIPARQVYTPRWAHTDDNHAWVEAWADGEWHFLGACEPEAVLDLGWFNAPASRGMLMHTKVFGDYDGPEEVMAKTACYTEINVTGNYAPTARALVKVVDTKGRAVGEAGVQFKIYNYAEFFTIAEKTTSPDGLASIEAGMGDLVVWGYKDGMYGFAKCTVENGDTTLVVLEHKAGDRYSAELRIIPPKERNTIPELSDEQKTVNAHRLAYEDSLRNAYVATFDTSTPLLTASRGNHETIKDFLGKASDKERAYDLLSVVSDKDLRDITMDNLLDAYEQTPTTDIDRDVYNKYVLCPRVRNEMLVPYREYFSENISDSLRSLFRDPGNLISWIKANIRIDEEHNPQQLRMSPIGVWSHRTTDAASRDIFFVSLCRTLGNPARVNPVNGNVELLDTATNGWRTVEFTQSEARLSKGILSGTYEASPYLPNPKYYTHFTLSSINEGKCSLMSYGETDSYETLLSKGAEVDAGDYILITGTRMADGSVLAHIETFPVKADTVTVIPLIMRSSAHDIQVIGSFDSENRYMPLGKTSPVSILSTTGRGYYVLGMIAPSDEPTNHALRDISLTGSHLEDWGGKMLLLFRNEDEAGRFRLDDFKSLPSTVVFGTDRDGAILSEIQREMHLTSATMPVFIIADTFNRVVFLSQGYTIGLGDRLVDVIQRLQ
ncbi:MAG: transglutaminase domain-containing protein [Bacteroidaceae bacterium]|nr:transglutaminase domain-containing protein [Bacteroidaceae bacterium]